MRESYEQGPANRSAPNPTPAMVTSRVWHGQGVHAGQVFSSAPHHSRVPTLSRQGEGNTDGGVHGESPADAAES